MMAQAQPDLSVVLGQLALSIDRQNRVELIFDGEPQNNVERYIEAIEKERISRQWSDKYTCQQLLEGLRGLAKDELGLRPANEKDTYAKVQAALIKSFSNENSVGRALRLSSCRRQGAEESVAHFVTDLRKLGEQGYPNMTADEREKVLLHVFLDGLKGIIGGSVRMAMPKSLSDAVALAQKAEVAWHGYTSGGFGVQPQQSGIFNQGMGGRRAARASNYQEDRPGMSTDNKPRCYNCGKWGHLQRSCPQIIQQGPSQGDVRLPRERGRPQDRVFMITRRETGPLRHQGGDPRFHCGDPYRDLVKQERYRTGCCFYCGSPTHFIGCCRRRERNNLHQRKQYSARNAYWGMRDRHGPARDNLYGDDGYMPRRKKPMIPNRYGILDGKIRGTGSSMQKNRPPRMMSVYTPPRNLTRGSTSHPGWFEEKASPDTDDSGSVTSVPSWLGKEEKTKSPTIYTVQRSTSRGEKKKKDTATNRQIISTSTATVETGAENSARPEIKGKGKWVKATTKKYNRLFRFENSMLWTVLLTLYIMAQFWTMGAAIGQSVERKTEISISELENDNLSEENTGFKLENINQRPSVKNTEKKFVSDTNGIPPDKIEMPEIADINDGVHERAN